MLHCDAWNPSPRYREAPGEELEYGHAANLEIAVFRRNALRHPPSGLLSGA